MSKEIPDQEFDTFKEGTKIRLTITRSDTSDVVHAEGEITRYNGYGLRASVRGKDDELT